MSLTVRLNLQEDEELRKILRQEIKQAAISVIREDVRSIIATTAKAKAEDTITYHVKIALNSLEIKEYVKKSVRELVKEEASSLMAGIDIQKLVKEEITAKVGRLLS